MNLNNPRKPHSKLSKSRSNNCCCFGIFQLYRFTQSRSKYGIVRLNAATQMLNVLPFALIMVEITLPHFTLKKKDGSNVREFNINNDSLLKKPLFLIGSVLIFMVILFVTSIKIAGTRSNSNSNVVRFIGLYGLVKTMIPFIVVFLILLMIGVGYIKKNRQKKNPRF